MNMAFDSRTLFFESSPPLIESACRKVFEIAAVSPSISIITGSHKQQLVIYKRLRVSIFHTSSTRVYTTNQRKPCATRPRPPFVSSSKKKETVRLVLNK
jgi:hypothetical protein